MKNGKKSKEGEHLRNYREYKKQNQLSNVKFGKESALKYIVVDDILPIRYARPDWNENTPQFWCHHSRKREDYYLLAEKYSVIQKKLKEGASLRGLSKDDDLRLAIGFWWSETCPVELVKFRNSYFVVDGHHRVTLAMEHKLGEIPAVVSEARLKRVSIAGKGN